MAMSLKDSLCGRFCVYYKPSKSEELACMGFLVVDRMIRKGKTISFEKSDVLVGPDTAAALARVLCGRCPFSRDDCDFAAHKEASPCGGYLLVGQLLESQMASLDDLRDMD
jgi:hypothetical protein